MTVQSSTRPGPILATATLILGLVGAGQAFAQAEMLDTDGDGMVSYTELVVALPDVTEEEFNALDADQDGMLSDAEMTAAQEAGLIVLE